MFRPGGRASRNHRAAAAQRRLRFDPEDTDRSDPVRGQRQQSFTFRLLTTEGAVALTPAKKRATVAGGMDIRLGVRTGALQVEGRRLAALEVDSESLPVDLLLLGIGAVPEVTLAQVAGLECADGIVVDAFMHTSDEAILAVGDCTRFPDRRTGADPFRAPRRSRRPSA